MSFCPQPTARAVTLGRGTAGSPHASSRKGTVTVESGRALTPAEIEDALGDGRLRVIYQPCYDIRTGAMVAVEALARVADPLTGELVAPGRFLPVAEEAGLIARLDEAVLAEGARQVARWRTLPGAGGLCLAVNLSVLGLDDPTLPERFVSMVRAAGLPTDALIVELTETVLSRAGRGHEAVAAELAAAGFNVTLDDFGTGNASFEYLKRFAVHGIKVDRSFVQHLGTGADGEQLAESLVRFCLSLGVLVVCEGVEEPAQLEALRRLGCPFVQGFLLDPPLTAEEVERRLRDESPPAALATTSPSPAPSSVRPVRPSATTARGDRWVTRSLAVLLVAILVGILGSAAVVAELAEDRAADAAQDRLESVDALAAARIDAELAAIRGVVTASSRSGPVVDAVTSQDEKQINDVLDTLGSLTTAIYTTALFDADGRTLGSHPSAPELIGKSFAHRDYFHGALRSSGAYVSDVYRQATAGTPWAIAVSAAVRDADGAVQGVIIATVRLEGLQSLLDELQHQHGVDLTLIDQSGVVLASSRESIGSYTHDPHLEDPRNTAGASDLDPLWATRNVPSLDGWLLAEQPRSTALSSVRSNVGVGALLAGGLVVAGLALLVLWLHADRRRRRLTAQVQQAYQRLIGVVSTTTAPIAMCDDQGRIILANPAFAALVDVDPDQLPGRALSGWIPGLDEAVEPEAGAASTVVTTIGEVRTVEVSTQLLDDGSQQLRLHTLTDVTPHRREHERLRAQGRLDPLTGVGNRVALRETLGSVVRSETASYAVVMLDLDGFKQVNDERGHAVGDRLLVNVAQVLSSAVGPNDLVARIGGDEFVVVLRLDDARQGGELADHLRDRVQSVIDAAPWHRQIAVGVSVGMAVVGVDGEDPDALLQLADRRMYQVKRRR
ncbi:EAL domain-containing protein [Nocardioides sp. BGMRC 2183]|nr:EAL domain-containing protein [Nocardioides sp. BGMRC 2183]